MKKSEKFSLKSLKSIRLKLSENNKLTKAISVIFLILIMSGLFAFIITGLYQFNLIPVPPFIQNIFFKTDGGGLTAVSDDKNIYDFLRNNEESDGGDANGGGYYLEYTLGNIKDIITNIPLPDNLYLETEAKYYTDGKTSRTEEMSLWKKGDKYKYRLIVNTELKETYTNDSKKELIENHQTKNSLTRTVSPAFSFDNIPHIKNINYYLNLLDSGEITNYYIYRYPDSNIAHILYIVPQLDQRELIDISLDTGIVLSVKSRVGINDDLFYECTTKIIEFYYDGDDSAAAKSSIQDSLFAINSR